MGVARLVRRRRNAPHGLTGRALTLGLIVLFAVVVLASPLHRFLVARSQLSEARTEQVQNTRQLGVLQGERARWDDPAYVAEQARTRLQYAEPGETVYVVIRPGDRSSTDTAAEAPKTANVVGDTWSSRMWSSVQAADNSS